MFHHGSNEGALCVWYVGGVNVNEARNGVKEQKFEYKDEFMLNVP